MEEASDRGLFSLCAPRMARNSAVKVRYGGRVGAGQELGRAREQAFRMRMR